jgi:hypothetical protein
MDILKPTDVHDEPAGSKLIIVGVNGSVTGGLLPLSERAINFYAGPTPVPVSTVPPTLASQSQPAVLYESVLSTAHDPLTLWRIVLNAMAIIVFVVLGALYITSQGPSRDWFVFGGVIWCIYVMLSLFFSNDASALRNHMDPMALLAFTGKLRATPPVVWAEIVCFHYERRTRTTYKNGKAATSTERVRVVTHHARENFGFAKWCDTGGPPVWHPEMPLLEVAFEPVLDFADGETHGAYEAWKNNFYARNTRDAEQTRTAGMDIGGFKEFVLIQQAHFWFINSWVYTLFVLFLLGFVWELCIFSRFPHSRYKLVKQVAMQ